MYNIALYLLYDITLYLLNNIAMYLLYNIDMYLLNYIIMDILKYILHYFVSILLVCAYILLVYVYIVLVCVMSCNALFLTNVYFIYLQCAGIWWAPYRSPQQLLTEELRVDGHSGRRICCKGHTKS